MEEEEELKPVLAHSNVTVGSNSKKRLREDVNDDGTAMGNVEPKLPAPMNVVNVSASSLALKLAKAKAMLAAQKASLEKLSSKTSSVPASSDAVPVPASSQQHAAPLPAIKADLGSEPAAPSSKSVDIAAIQKKAQEHARAVAEAIARSGVAGAGGAAMQRKQPQQLERTVVPGIKPVHDAAAAAAAAAVAEAAAKKEEEERLAMEGDPRFFDPEVGAARARPRAARFSFVEPGAFQEAGERRRMQKRFGRHATYGLTQRERRAGDRPRVQPHAVQPSNADADDTETLEPPPAIEWWDRLILVENAVDYTNTAHRPEAITQYIEHPVEIDPPLEAPPPPPQPLRLTERERKKMRRQRKEAKEKERRQLVAEGLLEPPKPKVKLSNLMKVLGGDHDSSAVYDPTRVEREIQMQREERMRAQEDRNLANMLTPDERREKTLAKLLGTKRGDGGDVAAVLAEKGVPVSVYRVGRVSHARNPLSNGRLRYKVTVNAHENHMTGLALLHGGMALVIVEGVPKSQKRYQKLMLNRIDWNPDVDEIGDDDDADGAGAGGSNNAAPDMKEPKNQEDYLDRMGVTNLVHANEAVVAHQVVKCELLWSGVEAHPAFKGKFRVEATRDEVDARRVLEAAGVVRYLDLALGS